jgi:hypothetical protein
MDRLPVAGGCGEIRGVSLDGDTLNDVWEMPFILDNFVSIQLQGKMISVRGILSSSSSRRRVRCDFEETSLHQEVPNSTRLVHIDLDEIPSFPAAKLASTTSVLPDEVLLDDKIRLG